MGTKEKKMKTKTVYFENIRNKEKFFCTNMKDIQKIDGVDYLRVFRMGTQRDCLVKLDSLRKIPETK
jgi:ribosomal protein L19E